MASILAIARAVPPRSPEREALAAAIERHANAVRGLEGTQKAIRDMQTRRIESRTAVDVAKANVESAKANAAAHMTAAALGQVGDAPSPVKVARAALQEAEDNLDVVQTTFATLEENLKAWNEDHYWAKRKLPDAIRDVVKSEPGIRNLIAKFTAARDELEMRRHDLRWFSHQFMVPDDLMHWESLGILHEPSPEVASDRNAPWAAAIEGLASNSEATLPI